MLHKYMNNAYVLINKQSQFKHLFLDVMLGHFVNPVPGPVPRSAHKTHRLSYLETHTHITLCTHHPSYNSPELVSSLRQAKRGLTIHALMVLLVQRPYLRQEPFVILVPSPNPTDNA